MVDIIVCIKQILDVTQIKVDSKSLTPITEGVPKKISDFDKNALEEAIRLKEKHGGKVTVVTAGPSEAKSAIKEALAMGADEASIAPALMRVLYDPSFSNLNNHHSIGGIRMSEVLVFSENKELAFELIAKARELADVLGGELSVLGYGDSDDYISQGADKVYLLEKSLPFKVDQYTEVITFIIEQYKPEVLLIGATRRGRELAPKIAQRLGVGCATDCLDLYLEEKEKKLKIKRLTLGGRFIATQIFQSKPQIATVPHRRFEKLPKEDRIGEVVQVSLEVSEPRTRTLEIKEKEKKKVNIEDAEIIVSVGRGIKKKEDIKIIEELAETIGGEVGCSRSIASDLKWLSEEHWVGLSGHKVKPKLYLAIGISGQIQHIAGVCNS